jgi:hypothetical protein
MKELDCPGQNCVSTDVAPGIIGKKTSSVNRIRRELDKQNAEFFIEL